MHHPHLSLVRAAEHRTRLRAAADTHRTLRAPGPPLRLVRDRSSARGRR